LPPTGKPIRFEEIVILRFADGKVVEQRGIPDNLAALRQLGVMPTPRTE
jgi:predicted ester cyclase